MEYFYIHTISYYVGNNRENNITYAFNKLDTSILSKTENKNDINLLIIYVIYDEINDDIINKFNNYKNLETDKTKILVLYRWNTGGTVQTLYYTYKYLIEKEISCKYIGVWEDDALFKNNYFLDSVEEYLKNGYIFVGSLWPGNCKTASYTNGVKKYLPPYNKRTGICPFCRHYNIYPNTSDSTLLHDSLYVWCEDPYITTLDNLKKISEKLGHFTLAPENEKYTHCSHGINYGEVGFPTRLFLNDFKFYGLPKYEYFISLEEQSNGNKYN
jgi:hypothetical protein